MNITLVIFSELSHLALPIMLIGPSIHIFRFVNSLQSNNKAHFIWKDNIKLLFLKGCRICWSHKVLQLAFEANITKFDPGKAYFSQHVLGAICTFSFEESLVVKCVNILYDTRYSLIMLVSVPKQHLEKVTLFANILIGQAYLGQFASRMA